LHHVIGINQILPPGPDLQPALNRYAVLFQQGAERILITFDGGRDQCFFWLLRQSALPELDVSIAQLNGSFSSIQLRDNPSRWNAEPFRRQEKSASTKFGSRFFEGAVMGPGELSRMESGFMHFVLEESQRMGAKRGSMRPLLAELFTNSQWNDLSKQYGLSMRQSEIARLICRGCTNEDIATSLTLAEGTVRMHTEELFRRVGVHTRMGLLVSFVEASRVEDQKDNAD